MKLLLFIVFLFSILLSVCFVIDEVNDGKYKRINNNNEKEEELIKEFESKYPNKTVKDLKIEIEKISDMLLGNEESNRYSYRLQKKASSDRNLNNIRNSLPDSVNILDIKKNELKAQVNYLEEDKEYTIVMHMNIVAKGRVFLKNYKTMKRKFKEEL